MAIPKLAVELIANSTPLVQAIDICKAKVLELRKKLEAGDLTTDVFQKLVDDLKVAQASLGYFQQKYDEFGKKIKQTNSTISDSSGRAALGIQGFTRVIQDAPYGFIGIANNLQELPNAFAQLRKSAELTGKSLTSTIVSSLTGPAGLGLALSIVTSALTFATVGFDAWTRGFGRSKAEIDKTKDDLEKLSESIKGLPKIKIEAEGEQAAAATQVNSLVKIITDSNSSLELQKRAKEELKKVNESYFGDLNTEKDGYDKLTKSAKEYTQAIFLQSYIKGIKNDISAVAEKNRTAAKSFKDITTEIGLLNQAIFDVQNNKGIQRTFSVPGSFSSGLNTSLSGTSEEEKNLRKRRKSLEDNRVLTKAILEQTKLDLIVLNKEFDDTQKQLFVLKPLDTGKSTKGLEESIENLKNRIKDLIEKAKEEGFELPPIKLADNKKELKAQLDELTKLYKKYKQQFQDFNKLLDINETFTGKTRDTRIEELKKELQELKPVIEDIFKEKDKFINSNQSDDNLGFRINFETNFREQLANYKKLQNDLLVLTQERLLKQRDAEIQSAVKSVSLTDRTLREIIEINERADRGILLSPTTEDIDQWNTWRDATIRAALEASGEVSELFINTLEQINKAYATETIKLKVELQVIAPKNAFTGIEANKDSILNKNKGSSQYSSILPELDNTQKTLEEKAKEYQKSINEIVGQIQNGFGDIGAAIGASLANGGTIGEALQSGAEALFNVIGSVLKQIGEQMIALGVVKEALDKAIAGLFGTGPGGAIAAVAVGVALIALGSAFQQLKLTEQKGIRAFAEGGIVMGPTLGLIGEAGKEAVIPLDRLSEFVNGAGGTKDVFVRGQLQGEMIYLQQQRVAERRGRII